MAAAITARTARRLRAGLHAGTAAHRARDRELDRHGDGEAARRSGELDLDLDRGVGAAAAAPRPCAAEDVGAEERREEVAEPADVEVGRLEAAAPEPGVPVA